MIRRGKEEGNRDRGKKGRKAWRYNVLPTWRKRKEGRKVASLGKGEEGRKRKKG